MKQRTIESQTTVPCSHEPKPSDYQIHLNKALWVNLIDAVTFLVIGVVLYGALSATANFFWG
ncbi:hypothetical protein [Acinetobacter soli]|uniref:hypothetical protein n=1 Tax=Acinetobacter soli TaxID=487316 RepID=UPI00125CA541|nr:hypothetical protein [Acinetobacter soli]